MTSHEPHRAAGNDSEPRSELADRIHAMLGRRVRDLRVEFDGRGLILRGRAGSYHAKQLAQHVAKAALGLPLSANEIVVSDFRRETPAAEEEQPTVETDPHTAEPTPHTTRATRMTRPHS